MKFLLLFALALFAINTVASPVNCEGAPKEAVTELPSPLNEWALVFCSPSGHAIAPIDGHIWLAPNGKPFLFQAAALTNAPILEAPHSAYYQSVVHRKLEGKQKYGTNMMLAKAGLPEDQSLQPWQLDVQSNKGILYNLFFYEKKGAVEYVLGCINRCNSSVLIKSRSLEQLSKELNK